MSVNQLRCEIAGRLMDLQDWLCGREREPGRVAWALHDALRTVVNSLESWHDERRNI